MVKAKKSDAEIEGENDARVLRNVKAAIAPAKRGRPARGEGSSVLGLRLPDSTKRDLAKAAKRFNVDVSTFVRRAALFIANGITMDDEPGVRVRVAEAITKGVVIS